MVRALIDAAADAKFDAVKFQIYDAEAAFSKHEMTTDVKVDHLYGVRPWWEVARDKILMPRDWFGEMFDYVRSKNLIPLSLNNFVLLSTTCFSNLKFGIP